MKVYIDLQKLAISKVVDATSPEYQGDINSNVFEILFFNFSGTNWFPTMSQLAPNGREAGDFEADTLGQGETHDYTEDGVSYKRYTFTMGDTWVLMKGRSNLYVWYNVLEGSTLKKCVGKLNVMINESSDNYFISNPVFNPAVKTYIDSVASDIEDELNDKIDAQNATIASLAPASPRVVNTVANIQALTENEGIAVATDTGHWYYWNGTQYVDGGVYQSTVLADGSVTYSKLASDVTNVFDEIEDELELQTSYLRTLLKSFCKNENLFNYQISANGSITATITDNTKADFLTIINSTEIKFKIPQGELRFFTFAKSDDKFYCWQLRGYGASVAPDNIATFTTNKVRVGYKVNPISSFIPSEDGFYKVKIDKYANTVTVYYNDVELCSITENSLNLELGFMLNVANVVKECSCVVTLAQNVKHLEDVIDVLMPTNSKVVDLIICMGQSNMAGRGDILSTPLVANGEAYEFRAVSDPTKLYPIIAPVGVNENQTYIDDGNLKTGGLIPAMCKEYYAITKTPLVVVSASKGGTNIAFWCANNNVKNEYIGRFNTAKTWLENNGYTIRHKYCIFCQGESNGDIGTTKEQYKTWLNDFCYYRMNQDLGMDMTFIISIGQYNGNDTTTQNNYVTIQEAQKEYCESSQYATLVSTMYKGMKSRNLMKDEFHYYQEAYNEVGRESGNNMACYTINNN